MKTKTQKIVMAALLAALVCVATMVIKLPSPRGYINLGDSIVLLSGWLLPPAYGFMAAAIGSMLADVLLGYGMYAPATLVIKGLMALAAYFIFRLLVKKAGNLPSRIISGLAAEIIMVLGYFVFEGFLYQSFLTAAVNIPFNATQGAVGLIVGIVLTKVFEKNKILM